MAAFAAVNEAFRLAREQNSTLREALKLRAAKSAGASRPVKMLEDSPAKVSKVMGQRASRKKA